MPNARMPQARVPECLNAAQAGAARPSEELRSRARAALAQPSARAGSFQPGRGKWQV